jgi:hypothetical protein
VKVAGLRHVRPAGPERRGKTTTAPFLATDPSAGGGSANSTAITYSSGMRSRLDLAMTLVGDLAMTLVGGPASSSSGAPCGR